MTRVCDTYLFQRRRVAFHSTDPNNIVPLSFICVIGFGRTEQYREQSSAMKLAIAGTYDVPDAHGTGGLDNPPVLWSEV